MAKYGILNPVLSLLLAFFGGSVFSSAQEDACLSAMLTCANGGTCIFYQSTLDVNASYSCICPVSFTGQTCQDVATYIYLKSAVYYVPEDEKVLTVSLIRDGGLNLVSTVELGTRSLDAISDVDFALHSEVVTFQPFTTFKNVTLRVTDDFTEENSEAFIVFLCNVVGGVLRYPHETATVHILDNDAHFFQVFPLQSTLRVLESDGLIEAGLLRSGRPNRAINVTVTPQNFAITYSLAPRGDFSFLSNRSLVFEPQQYFLPVQILINDDSNQQGTREFSVAYRVQQDGENIEGAISIIIDDDDDDSNELIMPGDGGVQTYLYFGLLPYNTSESQGNVDIPIYRLGNLNASSEIEIFTSSGTAQAGMDFMSASQTVTMLPLMSIYVLSLTIFQDAVIENVPEVFYVTMNVLQGGILGRPSEQTVAVTIRSDLSNDVTVNLLSVVYMVQESDKIVAVSVARQGRLHDQVSVVVLTEGATADSSLDFIAMDTVVIFPPQSILEMVEIRIVDDILVEETEAFHVVLGAVSQGMVVDPKMAEILILDDDDAVSSTVATTPPPTASPTTPDFLIYIIIAAVAVAVLVIIAAIVIAYFYYCRSKQRPTLKVDKIPLNDRIAKAHSNSYLNHGSPVPIIRGKIRPLSEVDPGTKEYPREKLRFYEDIGSGAFATVFRAEAMGVHRPGVVSTVAVKMLKETASETDKSDFLKELAVFKRLDPHPNVMSLLGCCTTSEPLYIILELMPHGNLQEYLRRIRTGKEKDHPGYLDATQRVIQLEDVLKFSSQITRGMEYLASNECIHRDLACRNILLSEDYVCKVSDFGLARDVAGEHQYEMKSKGRVPVRWLAPECLLHNLYTSQSDVWSFGVLMWELVTQGSHPYPGMSSHEVIRQVKQGYRLPKPEHCSPEIYEFMGSCWTDDPEKRPTFQNLRLRIESMLSDAQGYLCMEGFREEDYLYMSPGAASEDEETP